MTIGKPDVWMISISDNPVSQYWKNEVIGSWSEHYKVNHFEAVTPADLHLYNDLKFATKSHNRPFTETEKAVWYSHYLLWKKALNGPIIIIEHDIFLHYPLPKQIDVDIDYYAHTYVPKLKQYRMLPAGCYYVSPQAAEQLITNAITNPIGMNVDGHIFQEGRTLTKNFGENIVAEQLFDPQIGTTIDHGHKK